MMLEIGKRRGQVSINCSAFVHVEIKYLKVRSAKFQHCMCQ